MNKKMLYILRSFLVLLLITALTILPALPAHADRQSAQSDTAQSAEESETISPTVIRISSEEEFLTFAENCRLDTYSQNLEVSLEADLNLIETPFTGVPIFCGTFLGNDHTISGLHLTKEGSYQGLFRHLTETAQVQDLTVTGRVTAQGSQTCIGGLAGSNAGLIKNCSFSGIISGGEHVGGLVGINSLTGTLDGCDMEGTISGSHFVGGLAGENQGVIRNCDNQAAINTTTEQNTIEISDITMDTLTNSESAGTVTDIGGITGTNSGVIRLSQNYGQVGYQQIGYNMGGIAGSQNGYILDCENHGAIFGRKEVGGIAGQMEPVTKIEFTEDTLQILKGQLDTLSSLTKRTASGIENNSSALNNQVATLKEQTSAAKSATDQILSEIENLGEELWELGSELPKIQLPEDGVPSLPESSDSPELPELPESQELPELPDMDGLYAAQNGLSQELGNMSETMNSILATAENTGSTLSKDIQAINKQIQAMEGTLGKADENLGGTLTDISDADTDADVTGKIRRCTNYGSILADINAGGIAGAISFENDLDPEDDLEFQGDLSLNAKSELRAVITDCENHALITGKKQHAGGILGWQAMGLVRGCLNTGTLDGAGADYVGGITGQSTGFLRGNFVNCLISGSTYVGGIAGSGTIASDNRSMVNLLSGTERVGAILGYTEDISELQRNYYPLLSVDPGAIDGISFADHAHPLPLEDFLALDSLPEIFSKVRIYFVVDGEVAETLVLNAGDTLTEDQIPELPAKKGCSGVWSGLDEQQFSEQIYFDLTIEATYAPLRTTIASEETGTDDQPVLLVQGSFFPNAQVQLSLAEHCPPLTEEILFMEAWSYEVLGDASVSNLRFRIPQSYEGDTFHVLVPGEDGSWESIPYTMDGKYLVFACDQTAGEFAFVCTQSSLLPWILAGSAGAVCVLGLILWLWIRKKKKK